MYSTTPYLSKLPNPKLPTQLRNLLRLPNLLYLALTYLPRLPNLLYLL